MQSDFQAYIRERVAENDAGCWIWQRSIDRDGYGEGCFQKRKRRAHRLAYEAFVGEIPNGLQLDHLCRVRACVNPAHLEPVTPGENIRRGNSGSTRKTHCKRGHAFAEYGRISSTGYNQCRRCINDNKRAKYQPVAKPIGHRGERNARSKLRDGDITSIITLASEGTTHRKIAERFGVSRSTIGMIVQRKRWTHVERIAR